MWNFEYLKTLVKRKHLEANFVYMPEYEFVSGTDLKQERRFKKMASVSCWLCDGELSTIDTLILALWSQIV